jgi:hypothetical protein
VVRLHLGSDVPRPDASVLVSQPLVRRFPVVEASLSPAAVFMKATTTALIWMDQSGRPSDTAYSLRSEARRGCGRLGLGWPGWQVSGKTQASDAGKGRYAWLARK